MKLKFRGWRREVRVHRLDVIHVEEKRGRWYADKKKGHINFPEPFRALGKVEGLALSGDFLLDVEFNADDLLAWLNAFVSHDPKQACKVLAEMQLKAASLIYDEA